MDYNYLTGLTIGQLEVLAVLVGKEIGSLVKPGAKKPPVAGMLKSVAMVVMLMRKNVTQQFAAGIFGRSQSAASRRWDLIRPAIGRVLRQYVPDPAEVVGRHGRRWQMARSARPGTGRRFPTCIQGRRSTRELTCRSHAILTAMSPQ